MLCQGSVTLEFEALMPPVKGPLCLHKVPRRRVACWRVGRGERHVHGPPRFDARRGEWDMDVTRSKEHQVR